MQRKQWAFAVGASAVLAALATWQIRGNKDEDSRRGSERAAQAPVAKPIAAEPEIKPADRETTVDEPELRAGPIAAIADDEPKGHARLAVKVVNVAGDPVAGAEVRVMAQPPRAAKTDARGEAVVDGLLPGRYRVTAKEPGAAASAVGLAEGTATIAQSGAAATEGAVASAAAGAGASGATTAGATAPAPAVVRLGAAGQVTVEVVDEAQQPVDGATVELRGVEVKAARSAKGRAQITQIIPGFYQVAAWSEGYARTFLPITVSERATTLRVALARGPRVTGSLVDEAGKPVAGGRVSYEISSGLIAGAELARDAVTSDAKGTFTFAAMPVDAVRFVAYHAAHGIVASDLVTVEARGAQAPVKLVLPAGAVMRGKVVDAAGAPVAFARVRIGLTVPGARLIVPPREVFSDKQGQFIADGLSRRELTAVASAGDAASAAQLIDASGGEVDGVTLVLDEVSALAGVVVDEQGRPVPGAQVSAFPAALDSREQKASGRAESPPVATDVAGKAGGHDHDGHGHPPIDPARGLELSRWQLRGFPLALADDTGAFRLSGLPAGAYWLRARHGIAGPGERGAGKEVKAKTGEEPVKLVIASDGAVKGRVAFADGASPEQLTVSVGLAQHEAPRGELMLEGLAPQTYQLVLRAPSAVPRIVEVKVESGKTVDLGTVVVERRAPAAAPR